MLALLIAGLIGLLLWNNGSSHPTAGPSNSVHASAPATKRSTSTSATKAATTSASNSPSVASTPPTSTHPSTKTTTTSAPTTAQSTSNPPTNPTGPTDGQLAQAITDYYNLLPANTDQAWNDLTKNYQHTTAKNRKSYDDFWATVNTVQVSNVSGSAPSSAQATVTFNFKNGKVEIDQTTFGLVQDGGNLLIDSSSVQNSQTQ